MPDSQSTRPYQRVLLKLSGEALMGDAQASIDPMTLDRIAAEIADVVREGTQMGIVVGGGNFCRGASLSEAGMDRVASDHMGMLATVMNALAIQDALERTGINTRVMSAFPLDGVCEKYDRRAAVRHFNDGQVVVFSAGTGNPFFTTDSAASLRAIEIKADVVMKATKVEGIYSEDPVKNPDAEFFHEISYQAAIERELGVMDLAALCLCRDHKMPIKVFSIYKQGALQRVVAGSKEGTLVC